MMRTTSGKKRSISTLEATKTTSSSCGTTSTNLHNSNSLKRVRTDASMPEAMPAAIRRVSSVSSTATLIDKAVTTKSTSISDDNNVMFSVMKASQLIPRYKLFYRSHYQKKPGLPSTHIFTKVTIDYLFYSLLILSIVLLDGI